MSKKKYLETNIIHVSDKPNSNWPKSLHVDFRVMCACCSRGGYLKGVGWI